jgi:hypothetical protein
MPETPAILDACAKLAPDNVKIRTYAVTALSTCGQLERALEYLNANRTAFDDGAFVRLLGTLLDAAGVLGREDLTAKLFNDMERHILRPGHRASELWVLMHYKGRRLQFPLDKKQYDKVIELADADIAKFDADVTRERARYGESIPESDVDEALFFYCAPVYKLDHVVYKAMAMIAKGDKQKALDEIMALVPALEGSQWPGPKETGNIFGGEKFSNLGSICEKAAEVAAMAGLKDRAREYRAKAAEYFGKIPLD